MKMLRYALSALLILSALNLTACKEEQAAAVDLTSPSHAVPQVRQEIYQVQSLPLEDMTIVTKGGERHHFRIEVAVTPLQQARGLMFRSYMPPNQGMLFVSPDMRQQSFWMKNTLIPLDMVFVDDRGVIVNIAENTVPHDLTSHRSDGPAKAVLELNGGTSARLGIGPGDVVHHAEFGNAL